MTKSLSVPASRPGRGLWLAFALGLLVPPTRGAAPPATTEWPTATPESVGIDSRPLAAMFDFIREHSVPVHSIQLIRRGRLVLDAYIYPYDGRTRHDVASVTKSFTSTLIGLALARGHQRDMHQPVLDFFPKRSVAGLDERKRRQTLEDLLTMRSGWDCGVPAGAPGINADSQLAAMRRREDWAQFALDLPMTSDPGSGFLYCNANCHLLSTLLTRTTGTNALAFARRELLDPLDIHDVAWPADPQGNNYGWGDLQLHPHDMARFGQLLLLRGQWRGREVVPESWLQTATQAHVRQTGGNDHYGYLWWVNSTIPGLFEAVGRGGQRITVWPDKELVLVYTGGGFEPDDLAPFILKSLASTAAAGTNQSLAANPGSNARLRARLAAARRPPPAQPVPGLPEVAARISGKTYTLTPNELDLTTLSLEFNPGRPEAILRFTRAGQVLQGRVGLDGVERFSTDTLVELPFACRGRWLSGDTFELELDRVAGISLYRLKLVYAGDGTTLHVTLSERTGLSGETFAGAVRR